MDLAARFGADTALVIDLDAPVKTRIGYRILADFPRLEYADGALAHQMAAAPDMLAALKAYDKAVGAGIGADPELWADAARKSAAAQAKAEGRS